MFRFILLLVVLFSVLFIGACNSIQNTPTPAVPSGGGCGVNSVSSIASVCSSSGIEDGTVK